MNVQLLAVVIEQVNQADQGNNGNQAGHRSLYLADQGLRRLKRRLKLETRPLVGGCPPASRDTDREN